MLFGPIRIYFSNLRSYRSSFHSLDYRVYIQVVHRLVNVSALQNC